MFSWSCPSCISALSTTLMEAETSKLDSATRVAVTTIGDRSADDPPGRAPIPTIPAARPAAPRRVCSSTNFPSPKIARDETRSRRGPFLFVWPQTAFSACSRSAIRSSASSMPTEIRIKRIGDADAIAGLLRHARMRGARRMRYQSLGSAKAHRKLDHLQAHRAGEMPPPRRPSPQIRRSNRRSRTAAGTPHGADRPRARNPR